MTTATAAGAPGLGSHEAPHAWGGLRELARAAGLAAAWRRFAGVDGLPGPRGLCLRVLDAAAGAVDGGPALEADEAGVAVLGFPYVLGGGTLVATPCVVSNADAASLEGLLWLRLGVSEGLRDACLTHLKGRRSGDSSILLQQIVKLQLAEVLTEQLELEALLLTCDISAAAPVELRRLHGRVTLTDRSLLRLFGAVGYLSDGPGLAAHVSELLAETYLPSGGSPWC